jgi:hypothetical protein
MAYELFQRLTTRIDNPTLSIVPDGRITLNAGASRVLSGAGIKTVELLWDKARLRIALRATTKGNENAYSVSFNGNNGSASLRAKSFVSHIGWISPRRVRLPAVWDQKSRMLEVSLPRQFIRNAGATGQ